MVHCGWQGLCEVLSSSKGGYLTIRFRKVTRHLILATDKYGYAEFVNIQERRPCFSDVI